MKDLRNPDSSGKKMGTRLFFIVIVNNCYDAVGMKIYLYSKRTKRTIHSLPRLVGDSRNTIHD